MGWQPKKVAELTITVQITGDTSICRGEVALLEAQVDGGNAPFTYEWFDTEALENDIPIATTPTLSVRPNQTTVYFVRVRSTDDFAVDQKTVNVLPSPAVKLVNGTCVSGPDPRFYHLELRAIADTLIVSPSNLKVTKSGVFDYRIDSIPSGDSVQILAQFRDSPCTFEFNYGQTCNSCLEDFGPLTTDVAATNTMVCQGKSTELSVNATGNLGPYTYEWYKNPALTGEPVSREATFTDNPTENTTYYVKSSGACDSQLDSVAVVVHPIPIVEILDFECDAEEQSYCISFRTNGDEVSVLNNGETQTPSLNPIDSTYLICGIDLDSEITISARDTQTNCATSIIFAIPNDFSIDLETNTNTVCLGETANLSVAISGNEPASIEWFGDSNLETPIALNETTISVTPETTSSYYVRIDDGDPCTPLAIDSVVVEVKNLPSLSLDTTRCFENTYCAVIQTSPGSVLSGLFMNYTVTEMEPGLFEICDIPKEERVLITSTNADSCSASIEIRSNCCPDELLAIITESEVPSCVSLAELPVSVSLAAINTSGSGEMNITWYDDPSFENNAIGNGEFLSVAINETSTFFAIAEDNLGCTDTTNFTVELTVEPDLALEFMDCSGDSLSYSIMGTTNADNLSTNIGTIRFDTLAGIFEIENIPSSESVSVEAINSQTNCSRTAEINPSNSCCFPAQSVEAKSGRDCVISTDTTQLTAITDCVDCTYTWSPAAGLDNPNSPNPIATVNETTTYTVFIEDANSCLVSNGSVTVLVLECGPESVFLPNVFTPNGDNVNDELVLQMINISSVNIKIFSRFGNQVVDFEWTLPIGAPADRGEDGTKPRKLVIWDGRVNGQIQNPEVFAYTMEATCISSGTPIVYTSQGNISLIR